MKANTSVRMVTALFGLSMLAGYVVYSQLHQTQRAASSSKYQAPPNPSQQFRGGNAAPANQTRPVVASSSKSIAPLLPPPNLNSGSPAIEATQVPQRALEAPQHQIAGQRTNVTRVQKR